MPKKGSIKKLSIKSERLEQSRTLALFARAKMMKSEGLDVISFTAGEPDFPTPEPVKQAAIRAINENFTKYTPNQGIPELRKAIAAKLKRDNQIDRDFSEILISSGAKHSIYNALAAIVNRGDEVIFQSPYWVSYPEMAKLVDAKPVVIKTSADKEFKMTPKQLRKSISKKTKALIFNSPSNPTGVVYTQKEIEALAKVVEETGIFVISDEIYEPVIFGDSRHFSMGSIEKIKEQIITVNGVSKSHSMTGWRIGFMAAHRTIVELAEKVQSQMTSNACSVSQKAALAAYTLDLGPDLRAMVAEFDRRRKKLMAEVATIPGLSFVTPGGAFYLYINGEAYMGKKWEGGKIKDSDDLSEYLLKKHLIAIVPGSGFGNKNWLRISYGCSYEEVERGSERLKHAFAELRA